MVCSYTSLRFAFLAGLKVEGGKVCSLINFMIQVRLRLRLRLVYTACMISLMSGKQLLTFLRSFNSHSCLSCVHNCDDHSCLYSEV